MDLRNDMKMPLICEVDGKQTRLAPGESMTVASDAKSVRLSPDLPVRRAPIQPTVGRVHERVKALILSVKSVPEESIVPQASLIEDLDFDTADLVLYLLNLEEQFQIQVRDAEAERLLTVGETEDFLSDRGKL